MLCVEDCTYIACKFTCILTLNSFANNDHYMLVLPLSHKPHTMPYNIIMPSTSQQLQQEAEERRQEQRKMFSHVTGHAEEDGNCTLVNIQGSRKGEGTQEEYREAESEVADTKKSQTRGGRRGGTSHRGIGKAFELIMDETTKVLEAEAKMDAHKVMLSSGGGLRCRADDRSGAVVFGVRRAGINGFGSLDPADADDSCIYDLPSSRPGSVRASAGAGYDTGGNSAGIVLHICARLACGRSTPIENNLHMERSDDDGTEEVVPAIKTQALWVLLDSSLDFHLRADHA